MVRQERGSVLFSFEFFGVEAEVENDPFEGGIAHLQQELGRLTGSLQVRKEHLYDPPVPEPPPGTPFELLVGSADVIEARTRGIFEADRVGCRVGVKTTHGGVLRRSGSGTSAAT
jgi:hypothetical protein